jgi:hypothetical protein
LAIKKSCMHIKLVASKIYLRFYELTMIYIPILLVVGPEVIQTLL